ncbi:patatin-like phospholipase family protein [bacterium 210820-DFI.6.37]|nr:patatin-like phospholipase family protein [bacterium 210820-DFI.6.37]
MRKNAFVLSGGGSRGGYEIGVWQALRELGIPIHIITGASVGALNGAMAAQNDFELALRLWKELETHMIFDVEETQDAGLFDFDIGGMTASEAAAYAKEILFNGGAGTSGLEAIVKNYVSEEKIRKSAVEFGVVTVEFPSLRPHYLFTEDIPVGKLPDYILASAACFPAVQAKEIDGVRYIDGGYADVMPVELAMKRGADNIIAVHLEAAGFVREDTIQFAEKAADSMRLIKSKWDLGNFLVFSKANTRRIIRLGYLDAMKSFGAFDGEKYTFAKGKWNHHQLSGAEAAAEIFHLDPLPIYQSDVFLESLAHAVRKTPAPDIWDIHSPEDARDKLNPATLTLYIGRDLKKKEAESVFTSRNAFKLLKTEILAANFLLQNSIPIEI